MTDVKIKAELTIGETDIQILEKMVARAIQRGIVGALKIAKQEGLLPHLLNRVVAAPWEPPPAPRPEPAVAAAPAPAPTPEPAPVAAPEPKKRAANGTSKQVQEVRKLVRVCADRPEGFITTEDAADELANGDSMERSRIVASIRYWVTKQQVEAAVVTSVKPPSKGLEGRLHVKRSDVVERNKLRIENAEAMLAGAMPQPGAVVTPEHMHAAGQAD